MKTLLSILFAVLLTVSLNAQSQYPHAPKVTLNCDSTLTIEQVSCGGDCYRVGVAQGGNPLYYITQVPVATGSDLLMTTAISISPSTSTHAVNVGNRLGGCSGTVMVDCSDWSTDLTWTLYNADGSTTNVPAKLGYQYQRGVAPVQVTTCPVQSAAVYVTTNGNGNGNGNGGVGQGKGKGRGN